MIQQTTKTLALRVRKQSQNAMDIATFLESHPKVTKVTYPGLASHPQKPLADKYHRNGVHGGMLWFDVVGGSENAITACAVMTHANMLKEDRLKVGITDGFIRVSCGIEDTTDLKKSLSNALDAC